MAYQIKQNPGYSRPIQQQSCDPMAGMGPNMGKNPRMCAGKMNMDMSMPVKPVNERTSKNQFPVGMAYVPWQKLEELYDLEKGFRAGTIFPELNLPFTGRCEK